MLEGARRRVEALLQTLLAAPDRVVEDRFGTYRSGELLIEAAAEVRRTARPSRAWRLCEPVTVARWDFHGLLLPLQPVLDAEPAPEEWPVRHTLTHVLNSQRFWAWLLGFWAKEAARGEALSRPRGEAIPDEFRRRGPRPGTLVELRAMLDEAMDASFTHLAALEAAGQMETELPFNLRGTFDVPVAYYPQRWAGHLWEHTIQVETTLVALDRQPTEVERMARVLARTWGDLEAVAMSLPDPEAAVAETLSAVEGRLSPSVPG